MKFQYAPGLPGYGTQGADGSNGLTGLSMYFSDLNGEQDIAAITSKIENNEILSSVIGQLPGYPSRTYQTGEVFIDSNGIVYKIDLSDPNLFYSTGERLNTSTIFVEGIETSTAVPFTRYYNAYQDDNKFLVDNVYSSIGVGNYAASPAQSAGIYGMPAKQYGQIKYVDTSIGLYYPYTIWNNTVDTARPQDAIALVREWNNNHWRWGNLDDSGVQRGTNLSLDFVEIYMPDTLYLSDNLTLKDSSLTVTGNYKIEARGNSSNLENGDFSIYAGNGYTTSTASTDGGDMVISAGNSLQGNNFGGDGGNISILSGNGGNGMTAGDGGDILILSGNGGVNGMGTTDTIGGDIILRSGKGSGGQSSSTVSDGKIIMDASGLISLTSSYRINITSKNDITIDANDGDINLIVTDSGVNLGISYGAAPGRVESISSAVRLISPDDMAIYPDSFNGDGDDLLLRGGISSALSSAEAIGGSLYLEGGSSNSYGGNVYISGGAGGTTTNQGSIFLRNLTVDGNQQQYHVSTNGTTQKLILSSATPSSDINLKDIIEELDSSIILSNILNTKTYKWKYNKNSENYFNVVNRNQIHIGVVAQEIKDNFPELVKTYVGINDASYYGVDYQMFAPILIEAIKEQQNQIEDLKKIVETQQQQINQLLVK